MAFRLKNSLQTNADVQDHAQPNTSSECLVHFFREKNGMPHKTDQKVNIKQSKSRLCKIKIHQSRYQKQILARQTSPPSFNLDKNGRHQHPRNTLPWPTPQHWSQYRKHTPAPKIRLHLQQSIISAEIKHNSEPPNSASNQVQIKSQPSLTQLTNPGVSKEHL